MSRPLGCSWPCSSWAMWQRHSLTHGRRATATFPDVSPASARTNCSGSYPSRFSSRRHRRRNRPGRALLRPRPRLQPRRPGARGTLPARPRGRGPIGVADARSRGSRGDRPRSRTPRCAGRLRELRGRTDHPEAARLPFKSTPGPESTAAPAVGMRQKRSAAHQTPGILRIADDRSSASASSPRAGDRAEAMKPERRCGVAGLLSPSSPPCSARSLPRSASGFVPELGCGLAARVRAAADRHPQAPRRLRPFHP